LGKEGFTAIQVEPKEYHDAFESEPEKRQDLKVWKERIPNLDQYCYERCVRLAELMHGKSG
jgi:hypothetical protein